ncbi:MAG: peptide-methionine (S)-S-oxide reductase, partial [Acidiferrobacterales bacterium]
ASWASAAAVCVVARNAHRLEHAFPGRTIERLAEESKPELERTKPFKKPIGTDLAMASEFYVAQEYRQDYHHKNPIRYKLYRYGCGQDQRLNELWGEPSEPKGVANRQLARSGLTL